MKPFAELTEVERIDLLAKIVHESEGGLPETYNSKVGRQRVRRFGVDVMVIPSRRHLNYIARWMTSDKQVVLDLINELVAAYEQVDKLKGKLKRAKADIKELKPHAKHFRVNMTGYEIVNRLNASEHAGYFWQLFREMLKYEDFPGTIYLLKYNDPEAYGANLRMFEEGVLRKRALAKEHLQKNYKEYLQELLDRVEEREEADEEGLSALEWT